MNNIRIYDIELNDIDDIVKIYNSNKKFLYAHMGVSSIYPEFIFNEIDKMKQLGFKSQVIKDGKNYTLGICEYKIDYIVYLSLLMLDSRVKGIGLGKLIYNQLEIMFKSKNVNSVRIDVVYDYKGNALKFWEKQGFTPCGKINLEWNGHKSAAVKMYKTI